MKIKEGVDQIRKIISKMDGSKREVYEELMAEAEGWKMRLQELDDEDEDE